MSQDSLDSLDVQFKKQLSRLEVELDRLLPKTTTHSGALHEAMRYSVLEGGKRIRPLLCLCVCELLGGDEEQALIAGCAIEFIHSYSLIHDDLPCMDDDELRRGKLTCHKKFGEAMALLAGDALLTLAFETTAKLKDPKIAQRLTAELASAAGTAGMVGGQMMELATDPKEINLPMIDAIHILKTGQLIKTSCLAGAVIAGASPEQERHILKYGEYLGFAFQIIDDILDGDGYLQFMSAHEARDKAAEVIDQGKKELADFKNNQKLNSIADLILSRGTVGP